MCGDLGNRRPSSTPTVMVRPSSALLKTRRRKYPGSAFDILVPSELSLAQTGTDPIEMASAESQPCGTSYEYSPVIVRGGAAAPFPGQQSQADLHATRKITPPLSIRTHSSSSLNTATTTSTPPLGERPQVPAQSCKKPRKKESFGFRAPNEQPVYDGLVYRGLYGTTSPFDRIRVWETLPDDTGATTKLYDCTCNSRKPAASFQNVRRHVYRHNVTKYECPQCALVFDKHWSLNAHQRAHRAK